MKDPFEVILTKDAKPINFDELTPEELLALAREINKAARKKITLEEWLLLNI